MESHEPSRKARIGRFDIGLPQVPMPDLGALLRRLPDPGAALKQIQERIAASGLGAAGIEPKQLIQEVIRVAGPMLIPPADRVGGAGPEETVPPGGKKTGGKQRSGGEGKGAGTERNPQVLDAMTLVVDQALRRVLVLVPLPKGGRISPKLAGSIAEVLAPPIARLLYDLGFGVAKRRPDDPEAGPVGA